MNRGQDGDHLYRGGESLDPSAASCLHSAPLFPLEVRCVEADAHPRLLDLCCGAGGAAAGYAEWFDVVGVDNRPQPNYPFEFHQADALTFSLDSFDAIHASPPCQRWSDLAHRNGNADAWPDLITPIRARLEATGLPYVIENVEGAPLVDPIMLCGTMFPELRVLRHRLFESNVPLNAPAHRRHPLVFTHDRRKAHHGRLDQDTAFVQVTGGGNCTVANKRDAMGVPWMTGAEANEAIPPAYTAWIGRQLVAHVKVSRFQVEVDRLAALIHDNDNDGDTA